MHAAGPCGGGNMPYDITQLSFRPGATPRALAALKDTLPGGAGTLLACWSADIGKINRVLIIRHSESEGDFAQARRAMVESENWLGIGDALQSAYSDTFVMLPFLPALAAGSHGPFFEVRDYMLKPGVVPNNIERWQKALPARVKLSPILGGFYATSGALPRWLHIWPYKSLDDRHRIRAEAVKTGVWPPPGGGPDATVTQQTEIYVPAEWSPIK